MADQKAGRILVLVLHDDACRYVDLLAERFPEVSFLPCGSYEHVTELLRLERPQIALTFKVGTCVFPRAPLVEDGPLWVHAGGAGIDHLLPWDPARTTVTNSSGVHGDIIAQYVLCAMLMFNQNTLAYLRQQRVQTWRKLLSRTLEDQTLVVVGFGHVGGAIGTLARANGMRVIGVRSSPRPSTAADAIVGLDLLAAAFGEANHVAVALPLTPATRGLIGADELAFLRPEAHFVNVSRGGIVDDGALLRVLTSGAIAGATLDVFATEPLPHESPFWTLDNVVVTPHSSSDIEGWQERVLDLFSDNLRRWLRRQPLRNVVDPGRGY